MALFAEGKLFREAGTGSGGGDKHNKGYFVDESALTTAYPTAEAGDYAIVGATDTVWIWDTDNSEWVDSDQKGQVTSVNNQTGAVTVSEVPSQTGNAGKFLTTDGTDASWSDKPLVNNATGLLSLSVGSSTTNDFVTVFGDAQVSQGFATALGYGTVVSGQNGTAVGYGAEVTANNATAIGSQMQATAANAIQLGCVGFGMQATNSDANTFKVANANGNFEIMSADGTIPEARLADTTNASQGQVLTLDSNLNAVWQAGGGGGGLPSQTGNAGKFLTTDGTDASWSNKPITNTAPLVGDAVGILGQVSGYGVAIGWGSSSGVQGIAIGREALAKHNACCVGYEAQDLRTGAPFVVATALGNFAKVSANFAIQIGNGTNAEEGTLSIGLNDGNASVNYKLLDRDGTVPTARLTKVNTTATLAVADWSSSTQTVTVSGVKADSVVFVSPAPASASDYASAGILCTAQAADSLTFSCTQTPSSAIVVNIVCM